MDSPQQLPESPDMPMPGEGALCLPAHAATATAEDLRVHFVLAADFADAITVDAREVESVGQAVLQLLVAARAEAERAGKPFSIQNPSPAFTDRVTRCRLAEPLGLQTGDAL